MKETTEFYEVVELGGGPAPDYKPNIDICGCASVDKVADLSKGIPLPDKCCMKLFSRDFIEHFMFTDFLNLLRECRRVLKVGGSIEFITPNMDDVLLNHKVYNEHVHHCVIGAWDENRPEMRHKSWWTPSLVEYVLRKEGWRDIDVSEYRRDADHWKEPKMTIRAIK